MFAVLALLSFSRTVYSNDDQALSLKQCIAIALRQQPALRASAALTQVNRSVLTQARSAWYPWISAQGGYTRETNNYVFPPAFSHIFPAGATPAESNTSYDYYTSSIGFNWLLTNFGQRLYAIRAQQRAVRSARYDEQTTKADVAFSVTQGYYGLLAAQRLSEVADKVLRESDRHLEQAKGFLSVGRVSRIDVATAETNDANAQLGAITAKNNVELAMVNLLNAMGVKDADTIDILDTMTATVRGTDTRGSVQRAMENRPELESLYALDQGIRESEKSVLASNLPSIVGTGGYSWAGYRTPLIWNWSVGVGVQIPIFSGLSTYGKYAELKARQHNAEAQIEVLKQGITFQVRQAVLNLRQAEDSIVASKKARDSAELNLNLAEERYTTGAGSIIELTDAETLFASASAGYIQAVYQYNVAVAQLDRAEGTIADGY
ncbi:MAG: TolC family protein [Deltaproteobacteria bacterium]|nr:TolC family protein [Deltaproteobacteria bacterium]